MNDKLPKSEIPPPSHPSTERLIQEGPRVIGLDKLKDEDLIAVCKILMPIAFGKGAKYWRVCTFADMGIEGPGKVVRRPTNNYRFEFDFEDGGIEVIHERMGDYLDRVCPDLHQWWALINYLTERGCSLAQ